MCLSFSGGVTFGNIGRILDVDIHHDSPVDSHMHID